MRYDASNAECLVFTFKEGVLAAVAHDLKIRVNRFRIDLDDDLGALEATFDPASLEVVTARKDGRDAPGALGANDKRKIEKNIGADVLETRRYREIGFRSSEVLVEGDQARITGTLELHGTSRPLRLSARKDGARWRADVTVNQPDFGITPYRAMMGTLRVQPAVRIELTLPA